MRKLMLQCLMNNSLYVCFINAGLKVLNNFATLLHSKKDIVALFMSGTVCWMECEISPRINLINS